MPWLCLLLLLFLTGCSADGNSPGAALNDDDGGADEGDNTPDCAYPEGATEPMTLGEVLYPYAWPNAIHGDGTEASLDLENAACDTDEVLDWSPFDVLLFVSLPAW
ncbi:MAG TPA: hypothetical protein DIU15_05460 [Deltaproteobacteria bacterium]|nr:hypothetical protein [Deltaproteobacteria bacterium]HCP45466.1 hypothetical protein [Deltaproteobacteria bacterium]